MPNRTPDLLVITVLSFLCVAPAGRAEKLKFNRDIRPLLSDRCFYCHGPDEKKREAKLRIDTREGAIGDLGGYAAIVPGKPEESELINRITSHDRDEIMPPPKAKKAVFSETEVATLRRWIAEGAEYEGHWSFLPLSQELPPSLGQIEARLTEWEKKDAAVGKGLRAKRDFIATWARTGVDRFILDRLLSEGIVPSPEADPATLCRRMYLDLTGLLPTPEEVRTFAEAAKKNEQLAVEALADRLLKSPHYGERWGRYWLDQARYADSNGYSIDADRTMWPYRDWVIAALNRDLPFDQFTIEQLAGDLLPKPTKAQLVATGFHRNTLINQEGGTDPEQFRVEATIDRVNTTGAVWLGLTVGCAQCHSHKFDPISQREYYELFAFFNQAADRNNAGPTVNVSRGELLGRKMTPRDQTVSPTEQVNWEKTELKRLNGIRGGKGEPVWAPVGLVEYETKSNAGISVLEDNSLLADGRGPANDTYRVQVSTDLEKVAAVRIQFLPQDGLPGQRPGLEAKGGFGLSSFSVRFGGKLVKLDRASADTEADGMPVMGTIDSDPATGWAVPGGSAHTAVFVLSQPLATKGKPMELELAQDLAQHAPPGRFRIDVTDVAPEMQPDEQALLAALKRGAAQRSAAERRVIQNQLVLVGRRSLSVQAMVMKETDQPRATYLLTRGDFTRPDKEKGELNAGGIRAVAPALEPAKGRTRLDLAKWLVAPENPLTPRVTMNRVWLRYFGRGLVETEEDFGAQGSAPTHPELLDWLSREFIRSGWSMKAMHRLIVTSATYRQASNARPDAAAKDPRNLLLARQERLRVEAEIIRDSALCASGLLDRQIGGPSVRPPQPEGVYSFTQTPKVWIADTGGDRYRRAMYTMFYRSAPYPLLSTFDSPDFSTVCTRRVRSNTPLQSLTLANDPAFLEIAQGFAARLVKELPGAGDARLDARLRRAFSLALSREPAGPEMEALSAFVQRERAAFRSDPAATSALCPPGQSDPELAALVSAARVLLNTDNFITRE